MILHYIIKCKMKRTNIIFEETAGLYSAGLFCCVYKGVSQHNG